MGISPPSALDDYDNLCLAIGRIVCHWAQVEQIVDCINTMVFNEFNGDEIEPILPLSASRKIRFLKKTFRRIPILAPYTDSALGIAEKFNKLSEQRNNLIHGAITGTSSVDGEFGFLRLDLEKSALRFATKRTSFSPNQFGEIQQQIVGLANEAIVLAESLLSIILSSRE